jgi:hypothetical protein
MKVLIIGGARDVFKDLVAALSLFTPDSIIVINDIGCVELPVKFQHWVTLHPKRWSELLSNRSANKLPLTGYQRWSPPGMFEPGYDARFNDHLEPRLNLFSDYTPSGLSGLYAIKIAYHLGADKIILAGCPMDQSGHFVSSDRSKHWINKNRRKSWEVQHANLSPYVRSMSGWTSFLFSRPTEQWLYDTKATPIMANIHSTEGRTDG